MFEDVEATRDDNRKTLYLIDGSAYLHRAYHAIRGLATSTGLPTNATFGYTRILIRLMQEKQPEYAAVVFDPKGPTFRHEMYEDYKANRPPMPDDMRAQVPYIHEVTEAFNIPLLEEPGYEADDVIGMLAVQAQEQGFDVVVVTGDKDMNQLVTDHCIIWDPMRDRVIDRAAIKEKYGLEPEQLMDVMGFWGDTSDNIPGVPGVGEKKAVALVREYGGMDGVYEHLDEMKKSRQKENLAEYRDQAYLSRKLVTIATEGPVEFSPEDYRLSGPDRDRLAAMFKDLEFRQLQTEFFRSTTEDVKKNYETVLTEEALRELADSLAAAGRFAVDTETTSLYPVSAALVGLSFSVRAHEAWYVPCAHSYIGAPDQVGVDRTLEILRPVLEDPSVEKVGQNIKYDMIVLARHGVRLRGIAHDTMVASYLLNPINRVHGLDQIAMDHFGHKMISYEEVCGKGANACTFDKVPVEKAAPYAAEDADLTWQAAELFATRLEEHGLADLFKDLEMPLVPVLAGMEMRGIRVDVDRLRELSEGFAAQLVQLEQGIHDAAGEEFNIASPKQLGVILFEKLKLPTQKKTKKRTGYSTDESVLTALAPKHELPAMVLRYRAVAKLKSTYADALVDLINPGTGRIHTSFNQTVTATGRLSSSDPNLQNIPVRTEEGRGIRQAFIPEPGWRMFGADYSQIELRILAHYSRDPVLLDAYRNDEDIHTRTASEVFELDPAWVTPDMRRQAKMINFGIIYGMSPFRLARDQGITQAMAKKYIDNYFRTYEGVRRFIDKTLEKARETRKSTTLAGRTRYLPDINAGNRVVREAAERIAVNTPIQGTAADLIKIAMVRVARALAERDMRTGMLLTVHDELVFESPPEELDEAMELVREIMEGVWELEVPLRVTCESGDNWDEVH
ncbi:MAG: DNA polymerase I [Desulfatibacillaceae bacterium]